MPKKKKKLKTIENIINNFHNKDFDHVQFTYKVDPYYDEMIVFSIGSYLGIGAVGAHMDVESITPFIKDIFGFRKCNISNCLSTDNIEKLISSFTELGHEVEKSGVIFNQEWIWLRIKCDINNIKDKLIELSDKYKSNV